MTDRRSLSGSLNVTAGSGIWDSEGGATAGQQISKYQAVPLTLYMVHNINVNVNVDLCFNISCELVGRLAILDIL